MDKRVIALRQENERLRLEIFWMNNRMCDIESTLRHYNPCG